MSFGELAKPILKSNEILIKMLASPINPSDVNQIEGVYPVQPYLDNDIMIPGNEGCGEVVETGPEVKDLKSGDRVIFAAYAMGTWREFVSAKRQEVIKVSNMLDPRHAAVLSVNPCSAYRMLSDFGDNSVVIQNAANSNVGRMVIQMAKLKGLETVNIIRDRPDLGTLKNELSKLGANYIFTEDEFAKKETIDLIKDLKPSLALNAVGGTSATNISKVLHKNGQMVTYGAMSRKPVSLPASLLIFKNLSFKGFWMTQWTKNHSHDEKRSMVKEIEEMVLQGKLTFPNIREFKTEAYKEAFGKGDKTLFIWT